MPTVTCAARECAWNKKGKCRSKTVSLDRGHIKPRLSRSDASLLCGEYELSEDAKLLEEDIERFWGVRQCEHE